MTSTKPPEKAGKKPAKPARKAKPAKKKPTGPTSTRNQGVPLKADLDAYAEGRITPRARRMNRAVVRAFRYRDAILRATAQYEDKMRAIYDGYCSHDRGLTITNIECTKRVIFQKRQNVVGNANAYEAKRLIDEFIADLLKSKGATADEKSMAEFLAGIIQESRGKIVQTRRLTEFRRTQFSDTRLREAQNLLIDAFDVHDSKLYPICEVWDKEKSKWVPYL